jgi:transcriptional regulator with XRE-family HTH domain
MDIVTGGIAMSGTGAVIVAMKTLGELLRQCRLDRGWTQEDLEERIGISQTHISQIETGQTQTPKFETLELFAEVFDLDLNHLKILAGYPLVILRNGDIESGKASPIPHRAIRFAVNSADFTDADWDEVEEMLERRRRKR